MKNLYIVGAIAVVLIGGVLFATASSDDSNSSERKVAATIFPLYDITQEIAGDEFEVVLMLPAGASPHTFDPQPSLVSDLEGTQTVFSIGSGLDTWAGNLTESVGAEEVTVDSGIELRETVDSHESHDDEHKDEDEHGHEDEEEHADEDGHDHEDEHGHDDEDEHGHDEEGDEHGHSHGPIDPHYWLSIHNAERIAMNIATELGELDGGNASLYTDRAEAYAEELEALETELEAKVEGLSNRDIISLHDAWYYFSADFGLNLVGTFEPAAGEEPTPQYLETLQEEVQEHSVSTLFIEPQLSTASIEAFASDNDLGIALIDPLGGVEGRNSYIELMRYNVDQVVSALSN